jgi:hypothetical protein
MRNSIRPPGFEKKVPPGIKRKYRDWWIPAFLRDTWEVITFPTTAVFLFYHHRIRPEYGMTWPKWFRLGWRMLRNTRQIFTGTSYKAHMAMAAKLLELRPTTKGVVVECGCFLGGSTANLSLICEAVGRDLIVYDSFEGLPPAEPNDKFAKDVGEGFLKGALEVVQDTVRKHGAIDRCQFRKGWFKDTLPHHQETVVLAFLDVDYQASLHDCMLGLWPKLTDKGYIFIDEYVLTDYCALFYSEKWWREYFDTTPPGLVGAGCGVGVGQYFLGPHHERVIAQAPTSVAYTRKDFSGYWDYYPEDDREKYFANAKAGAVLPPT